MTSILALLAGMIGLLGSAGAATPTQGTLSEANPSLAWSGGPLAPSNPTGVVLGTPVCGPDLCDDYELSVTLPSDYDSTHDIAITVAGVSGGDYDVYVLDSTGKVIRTGAKGGNESVTIGAVTGSYTVRVLAFEQVSDTYSASATLVADGGVGASASPTPTTPPVTASGAPGYVNYPAPGSLPDVNNAGEPSIGTSFKTGATMYQASLSTYKVDFDGADPAQAAWTDVSAKTGNGCLAGSKLSLDPILFTDHATGRTFESQLTGANSATCYTDNDGVSWSPSTGGGIPSGVDHQTIGGGPFSADGVGALPGGSYPDAVYYCSQDIATSFCAVSRDGGTTFGNGVPTYVAAQCTGLHGHIKVAPDGTAYLPNKNCGGQAAVVVSTDSGLTWTVNAIPGTTAGKSDPSVGIARNGTVYVGYVGKDGKPGAAVSSDKGSTWTHVQGVGTEPAINNAVFPAVVAGDDDRAAFAYIGTPTGGNSQAADFPGVWHLYVDTTYDGGKTWVTSDTTPTDPVQRGSLCTSGTTCGADRNLLDFMDATVDDRGRVMVGYADGCIAACSTDPAVNNHDAYATIARQGSGLTLFSKYDPVTAPSTDPTATTSTPTTATATATATETATSPPTTPPATATRNLAVRILSARGHDGHLRTKLLVTNEGNRKASGVLLRVRDNHRRVGRARVTLRPGDFVVRAFRWSYRSGTHRHRIVGVIDPRDRVRETDERDNRAHRVVRTR